MSDMETIKSSRIIDLAKNEVKGFSTMFDRLEQKVMLGGLSNSTLLNMEGVLLRSVYILNVQLSSLKRNKLMGICNFSYRVINRPDLTLNTRFMVWGFCVECTTWRIVSSNFQVLKEIVNCLLFCSFIKGRFIQKIMGGLR